ncbi:hypothetical protein PGQ11_008522 [Apiospora arundinis]|uniref:Uncharacterized protein n=1 Tax=Apiospora arundinis TaxID=335852 RepID=A0ABR2IG14_9PEZI
MSSQNDYNDLQKEASTEVSSAGENANISDDIGKEHGGQKTTTSRSPRAFFNSFDLAATTTCTFSFNSRLKDLLQSLWVCQPDLPSTTAQATPTPPGVIRC